MSKYLSSFFGAKEDPPSPQGDGQAGHTNSGPNNQGRGRGGNRGGNNNARSNVSRPNTTMHHPQPTAPRPAKPVKKAAPEFKLDDGLDSDEDTKLSEVSTAKKSKEDEAMEIIQNCMDSCSEVTAKINNFTGLKTGRDFKLLLEHLNLLIQKLDSIELSEVNNVRSIHKMAIDLIKSTMKNLHTKEEQNKSLNLNDSMSVVSDTHTADVGNEDFTESLSELVASEPQLRGLQRLKFGDDASTVHLPPNLLKSSNKQGLAEAGAARAAYDGQYPSPRAGEVLDGPVQLLLPRGDGEFELNEVGLHQVLCRADIKDKKVVVVSVVGVPGLGKSFLLNFMLRYLEQKGSPRWMEQDKDLLDGFPWGPDPGTTGIMMWPEPFIIDDHAVIVLDTQGVLNSNTPPFTNNLVFSLSTLLSSVQILNLQDLNQLEKLPNMEYFLQFGCQIMSECESKALQKLVVLVRDWQHVDQFSHGLAGGHSALNHWMKHIQDGASQQVSEMLNTCFDTHSCFLLPHPGPRTRSMKFVGAIKDLNQEFKENLKKFVEGTLHKQKLVTKRIGGEEVQAQDLLCYMQMCLEKLQEASLKTDALFQCAAAIEHIKSKASSMELYMQLMNQQLPTCLPVDIPALHQQVVSQAVDNFHSTWKFGGENITQDYLRLFMEELEIIFNTSLRDYMVLRETERKEMVKDALEDARIFHQHKLMVSQFFSEDSTIEKFQDAHKKARVESLKMFVDKTKGNINNVELKTSIEKLDKRSHTLYLMLLREYEAKHMKESERQQKKDCEKALANAVAEYRKKLESKCPAGCSNKAMEIAHNEARLEVLQSVRNLESKYGEDVMEKLVKRLEKMMKDGLEEFKKSNSDFSELEKMETQAVGAYTKHMKPFEKSNASQEKLEEEYKKAFKKVNEIIKPWTSDKKDVIKYKPYIIKVKEAISKHYSELQDRCIINLTCNNAVGFYKQQATTLDKSDPQSLSEKNKLLKKQALDIMAECDIKNHYFAERKAAATQEMDKLFCQIQEEMKGKMDEVQRAFTDAKRRYETKITQLKLDTKKVQNLDVTLSSISDSIVQDFDNGLATVDPVLRREAQQQLKQELKIKSDELCEKNDAYEEPKDPLDIAFEEAINDYNDEMKDILEQDEVPEQTEMKTFHTAAVRTALRHFRKKTAKMTGVERKQEKGSELEQELQKFLEKYETMCAMKLRDKRVNDTKNKKSKKSYAIGIDLGTTCSCAAVYKDGKLELILSENKRHTTPSIVYFDDKETLIGEAAQHKGFADPKNCVSEVKRIIGRTFADSVVQEVKKKWSFQVTKKGEDPIIKVSRGEPKLWKPQEVSSLVLKELKQRAEAQLGSEVHDAVVTIPAYFSEPQRAATMEACKLAGLNVLRMLNEPTAAAITYGIENKSDVSRSVLVFDFGGGTCDISVLVIQGGNFTVKASNGDNQLGGEDFDDRLMENTAERIEEKYEVELTPEQRRRLRFKCEMAKRRLTDVPEYTLELQSFLDDDEDGDNKNIDLPIKRSDFEDLCKDLFDRVMIPVQTCLQEAGMDRTQIDEIVLAGGSSRIPKIHQMLKKFFNGKKLNTNINPDEAIALGAAIEAANLTNELKNELNIKDITPFSLGIGVVDNNYSIIIKKNSQLPVKCSNHYVTSSDYQTSIAIRVYQGEKLAADENMSLGNFKLTNLRRAHAGEVSVNVTFEINKSGILKVTAKEVGTGGIFSGGNEKSITIVRRVN